jgi:Flp pilus assembly protein TadD
MRLQLFGAALALALLALPNLVGQAALARSESTARVGDFAAATEDARRARRVLPWDSEPHLRLAIAAQGGGDRAGARRAIRTAIESDPGDPRLWLVLADLSTGAERARALERVEELDPLGAPGAER